MIYKFQNKYWNKNTQQHYKFKINEEFDIKKLLKIIHKLIISTI
jgi:hypothetical protein